MLKAQAAVPILVVMRLLPLEINLVANKKGLYYRRHTKYRKSRRILSSEAKIFQKYFLGGEILRHSVARFLGR
jgi:hypothetical protein